MDIVGLKGDLLETLIFSNFGSIEKFRERWSSGEQIGLEDPPSAAAIYRWIGGESMPRRKQFLQLCGVLDVDPLCLLAARNDDHYKAIEHLLSSFQLELWRSPALQFLTNFFGRQTSWPPAEFAREHYARSWHCEEFRHDPTRDKLYYGRVSISGSSEVYLNRPEIYHFAFKQPGFFRDRWLEYGIVERYGRSVRLFHINGHTDAYQTENDDEPSSVETWFGPGEAVFKVASLHFFELQQKPKNESGSGPAVRFPG